MKKIDLGQAITILVNMGVIAGIVFLGIELRQNNELLSAEARATRLSVRLNENQLPIENPDLANALIKHRHGDELTEHEQLVLDRYMETILVVFQNVVIEAGFHLDDRQGGGNTSWNAAHQSRSCSQADLRATGGDGLLYCFATD